MEIQEIHTLNARGNSLLQAVRDHLDLSPPQMLSEIQSMREQLVNALKVKGIDYINLRGALVPDHKKLEVALIFDSTACKSETYGREVFARVIPLLNHESQNSILAGDYIGENEHQKLLQKAFNDEVRPVRKVNFRHSDQFYII